MASKKSAKKPKTPARKPAKVGNLAPKSLSGGPGRGR